MPISRKEGFDTYQFEAWLFGGNPIQTALRSNPTLSILFGSPKVQADNSMGKQMNRTYYPKVKTLSEDLNFIQWGSVNATTGGGEVARGAGFLATPTPQSDSILDSNEARTTFYQETQVIPYDQIKEGKGRTWQGGLTYEQFMAQAITTRAMNLTAAKVFATGAGRMAGDGQFGSLRAHISDGLTAAQRGGVGGDESAYAPYYGNTRSVANTSYSSSYVNAAAGALTPEIISLAETLAMNNGATGVLCLPVSAARYTKLEGTYRTLYGQVQIDKRMEYITGGAVKYMMIGGVLVYQDRAMATGTFGTMFDSDAVCAGSSIDSPNIELLLNVVTQVAGWQLFFAFKHQLVVTAPHQCTLIENLESL